LLAAFARAEIKTFTSIVEQIIGDDQSAAAAREAAIKQAQLLVAFIRAACDQRGESEPDRGGRIRPLRNDARFRAGFFETLIYDRALY
jgi:hypothetical protein